MLALLLATSLCVPTFVAAPVAVGAVMQQPEGKPLDALDAWLKLYRKGRIDVRSKEDIGKESPALRYGLRGKNELGHATWAGDLDVILEHVARLDDAAAARALVEVAAIGYDDVKYTYGMAPYDVRAAAEKSLKQLQSTAALDELSAGARGEWKIGKGRDEAMQAAAIRALGLIGAAAHVPTIEAALQSPKEIVRLQAVEALGLIGAEQGAPTLVGVLERETSDPVLVAAATALLAIFARSMPQAGVLSGGSDAPAAAGGAAGEANAPKVPESARLAVRAACQALGRATWRADMALVRLLDEFRSAEAIPALIAVLERFRDHPRDVESGRLSGLLLFRVHELLVAMTGAIHPADQPEKWRQLWETEKDRLEVAVSRAREANGGAAGAGGGAGGGTSAGGFAGIPVQGTRVVFVLDLSGSMQWPMEEEAKDGKKQRLIRLDYAKRELNRAVDALAPNAQFNLVTFNGDDEAEKWAKDMVEATPRNRERFKKYVEKLDARGGTNLWRGLAEALRIRSLVYGNRYDTNVDEMFVLSDGAPTVGEVTDPIEILRLVEEANRFAKVRINTVFISSATPPEARAAEPPMAITPAELMRRMAERNGGRFRDV